MDGITEGYAKNLFMGPGGPDGKGRKRKTLADRGNLHPDGKRFDPHIIKTNLRREVEALEKEIVRLQGKLKEVKGRLLAMEDPEPETDPDGDESPKEPEMPSDGEESSGESGTPGDDGGKPPEKPKTPSKPKSSRGKKS